MSEAKTAAAPVDFEGRAREVLSSDVFRFFAAGTGDEQTLRENREAFGRWRLVSSPSELVKQPSARTEILGKPVALPVLVAPVSFQHVIHPEGDRGSARAAARADTVMCLSLASTTSPAEVADAAPGFEALVFTADSPYPGRRNRALRRTSWLPEGAALPGWATETSDQVPAYGSSHVDWSEDLDFLVRASSLPVIVKGVMSPGEARLACDHDAAAVIVSNHGGRHVDGVPATLDVLEDVVREVGGRAEVLIDGGIRSGPDVVKALALGARAVLIGRPVVWALVSDGERGVVELFERLREEIERALAEVDGAGADGVSRAAVARVGS
jgi:4-hydroxymandelate oxidase